MKSHFSTARTFVGGLLLSALLAPAFAAGPASGRFHYLGTTVAHPQYLPLAVSHDRVTVVLRLTVDPVAAVRAQRLDHHVTAAEHQAIHDQIDREQSVILPAIAARGGRMLARFHDAVNGIKVQIDAGELQGLAALPGVQAVMPVAKYHKNNAESVPFIGAPSVWQGHPHLRGEGIKIAILDTGIDYTHANFGGPGTVAAFTAAKANSTLPADPSLFGPNAAKVKGGIDLAGDAYDAGDATSVPQPDPNPLDCDGHGSHTAGTAAGFGIGADGRTYTGPYDSAAYGLQTFLIGPGVAPKADLYAIRIFGCSGSTNLVVDGIDWAIDNDMDVISMSLGSDFGTADSADALAVRNATRAGILVAAASGNEGPAPYITSDPGASAGAMSVAAVDSHANFPGALVALGGGAHIEALDANGARLTGPLGVVVLRNSTGGVSLGCNEAEYVDSLIAGKLVVTLRGTCARVLRAQLGQKHGAAAVAMINSSPGYPPFEGPIPTTTGAVSTLVIPFLGVLPTDAATLTAAATAQSFTANTIANPTYRMAASFSSGGPRFGDSALRPGVSAPGISIFSTAVGTGNGGVYESGTSMSTPHVAGVAALVRQAHPQWNEKAQRAAVLDTADPQQLLDYAPRIEGAGLVQALAATSTQAVVFGDDSKDDGVPKGFSFGFEEFARNFRSTREVTVHNYGGSRVVFNVASTRAGGSPHTVNLSHSSISIAPQGSAELELTLLVPVATVGATHDNLGNDAFQEVAGYVTFTPADPSMNGGVSLHVPYYLVPRSRSNVLAVSQGPLSARQRKPQNLLLSNFGGAIAGDADFYAWGLNSAPLGVTTFDAKAVGVQTNPLSATGVPTTLQGAADSLLVFAINTYNRFSNSDAAEFDILIDTNGDGVPDYDLTALDEGLLETGTFSGVDVTALINLATGAVLLEFPVDSPTDGSTVLMPVLASDLGITPSSPRFRYSAMVTNLIDGTQGTLPGTASFNAFAPAITNALFIPVGANSSGVVPIVVDPAEWRKTPAMGLMVVVQDNFAGSPQAQLIRAR